MAIATRAPVNVEADHSDARLPRARQGAAGSPSSVGSEALHTRREAESWSISGLH